MKKVQAVVSDPSKKKSEQILDRIVSLSVVRRYAMSCQAEKMSGIPDIKPDKWHLAHLMIKGKKYIQLKTSINYNN